MSKSFEGAQLNAAALALADGKPAVEFVNLKTGERKIFDRTHWLETRGVMMLFSLLCLTIGTIVTVLFAYTQFEAYSSGMPVAPMEWFFYIASLAAIWLGYTGGLTLEYGIRKRQIAKLKGEELTFMIGGPSFIFGVIMITVTLATVIGIFALAVGDSAPYESLTDDQWVPVILSMVTPLVTLLGGFLFAKAIRGKDKMAQRFA